MKYSVVIRAHQANSLLCRAIQCLKAQTIPPREIIIVDSSGNPEVGVRMREMADVHLPYGSGDFNYSRAIRIGIEAATGDYVLIHSAHVALLDSNLVENALHAAQLAGCEVFYCRKGTSPALEKIDLKTFDGRNGLANSCSMLPRRLVLNRGFREEVFSAEDQEWAAWFIREMKGSVLRITTPACVYENPHINIQKKINEDLAIALYVNQHERAPYQIAARLARAMLAFLRKRPERAWLHAKVAFGLLTSHFKTIYQKSRYF